MDQITASILGFVLGVALTAVWYLHTINQRLNNLERNGSKPIDKPDET